MRPRRIAVFAATLIAAASLSPMAATADGQNILYVNGASADCSDLGTGTSDVPFCTVQAAANVANPGDTVDILQGTYALTTITRSGTADAPIVFNGNNSVIFMGGATLSGIDLSHASNVRIENLRLGGAVVTGGSDITFTHDSSLTTSSGLQVTGAAANVTVLDSSLGGGVVVEGGATGTVLSTNVFDDVAIVGATNTAITSNTITDCNLAPISVTGSASGTRIENNIVNGDSNNSCSAPSQPYGIVVDASSAPGTMSDYNDVYAGTSAAYTWNGTPYTTAAALYAATGQAQHDDNSTAGMVAHEGSPAINSADSAAVGEQPVDLKGNPRTFDPLVTPTGAGPYNDYDRGALQFQDPVTAVTKSFTISATQAPVGGTVTLHAAMTDTWSDALTFQFEDAAGELLPVSGADGTYTTSLSTPDSDAIFAYAVPANGTKRVPFASQSINVVPAEPVAAKQSLSPYNPRSVAASDDGTTDPWIITGVSFDFGDGTPPVAAIQTNVDWSTAHTYAKAGTYQVTETVTDQGGNTVSTTSSFTTNAPASGTALIGTRTIRGVWQDLPWPSPPGATGIAQTAITGLPNSTAQLVAVTTKGTVELDIRNSDGTWRGWHALAQPGVTVKSVGIAGMPDDSTQIIEVTSTGKILQQIRSESGAWQAGWTNPTDSTGVTQAAITAMPDGTSQITAVTSAGKLLHNIRYTNGTWRGWHTLTQPGIIVKDASIAGMPDGSSQIAEVTSTGVLNLIARKANGSWLASGWTKIGTTAVQTSIAALPNGSTVFEAVTNSGIYDTNVRNTNGTWQGWNSFNNTTYLGTIANGSITGMHNGDALITATTAG